MDIETFIPSGNLDNEIENLVAKRQREGLDADEAIKLDRLIASRTGRFLMVRHRSVGRQLRRA